ncbi:MAG TPA: protease pro-enzyme activation domain-containing protein [Thermoplasmata archaeon]|nr:protease pro-enzyme activation domain-containing protein [Thermoplasmata archaeon]
MTFRTRPSFRSWVSVGVLTAVALLIVPALPLGGAASGRAPGPAPVAASVTADLQAVAALERAPRAPVRDAASDAPLSGSVVGPDPARANLSVVITLGYSNASRLAALLRTLADPSTAHEYLTAAEFDREFAPSSRIYADAVAYFGSFGVSHLVTYADRATITFEAPPSVAGRIFGTTIRTYSADGEPYLAPAGAIDLPAPLARAIVQVEGLGTASAIETTGLPGGVPSIAAPAASGSAFSPEVAGYLAPPTLGSAQIEYAPDLQVAYDERSLFATYGEPRTATVALLTAAGTYTGGTNTTRCGNLTAGTDVGPWVPADVSAFFAATLPAGEHAASVTGVPLNGAAAPTCLASWDTSHVVAPNTVALEMIGSTAPGARIYGVYGPSVSTADLDTDLATVLNPAAPLAPGVISNLENVSVVVTPWGFDDGNDSAWYASLEQAQARGITVLGAAGDSADDPASAEWVGSAAEFPASLAFDTFGTTAVGGTTLTLNPASLQIADQVVWNVSAKDTAHGGPEGTAGGVSKVIAEPSWQKSSSAASVVNGKGRGVPDLSALANDTAATVSINGRQLRATNATSGGAFFNASGTAVAVAIVAGLFAEVDHSLLAAGNPLLGFPDPTVYSLATSEYDPLPNGGVHGAGYTPNYTSPLPTLPFRDVIDGRNFAVLAGAGYDLASGWGSLDAYNFTSYLIVPPAPPAYGPLRAVQDWVNISDLGVTPAGAGGAPLPGDVASVQQNLFLANGLGAPIIWVQSVIYLSYTGGGTWAVNFTAWVVFPFWAIYPNESVYEFWIPKTGESLKLPISFDLTTYITPERPTWYSVITFTFGNGAPPISLPVPGAQYLLGGYDHRYNWQGSNYSNGPSPNGTGPPTSVRGFLGPQVALVGSPGGGPANITAPTAGTIAAFVEPLGATSFEPAETAAIGVVGSQTAERAENLSFTPTSANDWTVGYAAGSTEQGISVTEPFRYAVTFGQTGAPASLSWSVTISPGPKLSGTGANPSLVGNLQNGTYHWTVATPSHNYTITPTSGNVTVAGGPTSASVVFVAKTDSVTFVANGAMAFPFAWSVLIGPSTTIAGSGSDLATTLTYAKYSYHVTCANNSWAPARANGTFTIGASPVTLEITFDLQTYNAKVTPVYGVGVLLHWTVTVNGVEKHGYATNPFTFPLPNGTYHFQIGGLPAHAQAIPSNGSFTVHGYPPPNVLIQIIGPPKGPGGLADLGIWGYVLVGVGAAVVVLVAVFVARRRHPPDDPSEEAGGARGAGRTAPAAPAPRRGPPPPRKGRPPKRPEYVSPDEI